MKRVENRVYPLFGPKSHVHLALLIRSIARYVYTRGYKISISIRTTRPSPIVAVASMIMLGIHSPYVESHCCKIVFSPPSNSEQTNIQCTSEEIDKHDIALILIATTKCWPVFINWFAKKLQHSVRELPSYTRKTRVRFSRQMEEQ